MDSDFNSARAIITIKRFIKGKMLQSGRDGYVVGLSGGLDSAVAASLAVQAVGREKLLAVLMPYRTSSPNSSRDALALAENLGIDHRRVDITPMIDAYFPEINPQNRIRAGNKMARERMSILFDIAHEMDRLVLGTGNRTEICLGYTTWYGDSACSINPIGELYKTEVRALAAELDIPRSIVDKIPTADLWHDQSDEGEIGVAYETIDALLKRLVEGSVRSMSALEKEGFSATDMSRIVSLMNRYSFKRRLPDIAPLGKLPIPDEIQFEE
ncbi:MAG: NAD+ synthase [candidate division Zixibacteria bacterium]|nr:NAD+ synthase [candidate division Zixibacteria bacterium]